MESKPITPRVHAWTARALKHTNPALAAVFAEKAGDYLPLSAYDSPEDKRWSWCDIFDEKRAYLGLLIDVQGTNCLILNPEAREVQQVRIGDIHPIPGADPIYKNGAPSGVTINPLPAPAEEAPSTETQVQQAAPQQVGDETAQMPKAQEQKPHQGGFSLFNK